MSDSFAMLLSLMSDVMIADFVCSAIVISDL